MNGILLVDKPTDWTSHDVVAKLRGQLHERRAGHSGTLDPLATGLLVLFFGRATKAVEYAEADEKEYTAGIRFGLRTDTQDISGNVLQECAHYVTWEQLNAVLPRFYGPQKQIPPMYSAIKCNGQKLYEIARRGREVEREARDITIYQLSAGGQLPDDVFLDVRCSKGTYIRTLCHDIGDSLGCGACMSSLRRTRAGVFDLSQAYTMAEIAQAAQEGRAEELLLPVDTLFSQLDSIILSEKQEKCMRHGSSFSTHMPAGRYRAYSKDGEFLVLARCEDGVMKVEKCFCEV